MNKKHQELDELFGNFDFHHDYYSYNLKNERDIIVWLPPGYAENGKKYPVLYMNDGQNLFNPKTSYSGVDWRADKIAWELISKNEIDEIIIVGVYNNADRLEEYNLYSDKGKLYAKFLTDELKNFIAENYASDSIPENNAIIGSSMGGLNAFQIVWNYPNIFRKAACMSNSFWVDGKKILSVVQNDARTIYNQKIYIDCGTEEKELIEDNKKMCLLLKQKGFVEGKNLLCNFVEGAVHSEFDWSKRFDLPLKFLFGKKHKENSK